MPYTILKGFQTIHSVAWEDNILLLKQPESFHLCLLSELALNFNSDSLEDAGNSVSL